MENTNPQGVGDFPKKLSSAYTSITKGIGEMTPTELLIEARKLIEAPERWCQAQFAYTVHDRPTHAADITACKWCMDGAIHKVTAQERIPSKVRDECWKRLAAAVEHFGPFATSNIVAEFNDTHGHSAVLRAYDLAIAAAPLMADRPDR